MAITESAKKALRNSAKKRVFNLRKKDLVSKAVKNIGKLISAKKKDEAQAFFPSVQKILDKAVKTNLIKKNTAARKKSRIVAMIKKIA